MNIHRSTSAQVLMLATAICAINYARSALGPLQEAIKLSLALSDHQVALLQGAAIALPCAIASIPMGFLAGKVSRVWILGVSLLIAVLSCVLSAMAADLATLLLARVLAGLAIPGVIVAAYTMAGDLFEAAKRGRATMIVALGEIAGAPAAFALGGTLLVAAGGASIGAPFAFANEAWRTALLWMAAPLIPVILLIPMLRDPQRAESAIDRPAFKEVCVQLWRHRAIAIPLQLGRAALFIADGAIYVWGAPLLARNYHLPPDRVGTLIGSVLLVSGLLGPLLGGPLVDVYQRSGGPRRTMMVLASVAFLSAPLGLFALMPNPIWASLLMGIFLTLGSMIGVAALALSLIVIPGELRSLNLGISMVVAALFFVGLAPLAVSGLSTVLGGESKIGEALAIVCGVASVLNAAVFLFSARFFPGGVDSLSPMKPKLICSSANT